MPSNASLIAQANKIADDRAIEIITDGLTNLELISLVSKLKSVEPSNEDAPQQTDEEIKASEAATPTDDNESGGDDSKDVVNEPSTEPPTLTKQVGAENINGGHYVVADGKAVTCKRGIVGEGEVVLPEHVGGGKQTLDNLCDRGYLVKF